jgi:hypothetical protein
MTFQIPDTLILCGKTLYVETPCDITSKHPLIIDAYKPKQGEPRIPMPFKSSALHRGYKAQWEINKNGQLFLRSISGRYLMKKSPLLADWVKATFYISVGVVDEELTKKAHYEIVREYFLQLRVVEGTVAKWRLVKRGMKKAPAWNQGFDWPEIIEVLEKLGLGSNLQP